MFLSDAEAEIYEQHLIRFDTTALSLSELEATSYCDTTSTSMTDKKSDHLERHKRFIDDTFDTYSFGSSPESADVHKFIRIECDDIIDSRFSVVHSPVLYSNEVYGIEQYSKPDEIKSIHPNYLVAGDESVYSNIDFFDFDEFKNYEDLGFIPNIAYEKYQTIDHINAAYGESNNELLDDIMSIIHSH